MAKEKGNITIIGSGLGGSFLATLLVNRGYKVTIYERLTKEEICDTNTKRSYNITFLAYGINLLKEAKLWAKVKPYMHPLKGVSTQLSKKTKPIFTPSYDKESQYYAVSRASMLNLMLNELEKNPLVTIHYQTALLSVNRHDKKIIVQNSKTKKIEVVSCDVVIGADGANSLIRPLLQQGQHSKHTQEYSSGGYKQFTISKEQVKQLNLQEGIAYTWSAKHKFILAFPNFDGSLAALFIFPKDKKGFASLQSLTAINNLIKEDFPLLTLIQKSVSEQILSNPEGVFVTIHTDPWYYKDFLAIMGDAAHGFYPFFGQGTSAAFGDAMELARLLDKYGPAWEKIFPLYQAARKPHMDALGELSKSGLMRYARHKRADYETIYDKLEFMGSTFFPHIIQPPTLIPVMNNPAKSADYVERSQKQRNIAKKFGVSFVVTLLTNMISVYERLYIAKSTK